MKQTILILIKLLVIINLYAQEEGVDYYDPFSEEQILPPSPSVASLGKFGDIPVSIYTGIPNISIPIWNVQSKSLSLPISLNYHSSGLKVDEVAGWVGIGWALNSGGVISRTVYGKPDDQNGYLVDGNILPDPNTDYSAFVNWRPADAALNLYLTGSKDLQPDIYNYNFAGRSGKFMIDANNNIYTLDHNILDIDVDWINDRFTITDESGIQYIFGSTIDDTRDAYETTIIDGGGSYKSAWHLVEIIAPGNTDKIGLYYKQENLDWSVTSHETRYVRLTAGAPTLNTQITPSGVSYFTLKIDSIISNRSIIVFDQELGRDDLSSGSNGVKLGSISIRDNDNDELKKFSFNYGYLSTGGTTYKDKRLKLDSIIESSQNQQKALPPYQFYYNENNIPKRGSKSQDHWGYYNGAVNTTLVPSIQFGNEVLAGANREPNETYLYGGILEKIVYPTGGYTEFEYEPNRYSYIKSTKIDEYIRENNVSKIYHATYISDGFQVTFDHEQYIFIDFESQPYMMEDFVILNIKKNGVTIKSYTARADETLLVESGTYDFEFIMASTYDQADLTLNYTEHVTGEAERSKLAGGLRIKKISNWDNNTVAPIVKKYIYEEQDETSNGILTSHFPKYTYNIKHLNVTGTVGGPTGLPNEGDPFVFMARSSHNLGQGAKTHGADVAYQKVVELLGENGENGSVQYFYTNSRTYQDHEIRANPFPPTISRDWQRGLLTKQIYYDKNGIKKKEIKHNYTFNDQVGEPNFTLIPGVKATYILKSNYPANTEYSWITYTHEAGWKYKNKTTEISYYTNDTIIKTTEYSYENKDHCQPTEIKSTNSNGTVRTKKYRYPQDYNLSASNYSTLIGKNILNKPIDKRTYNGSTLASGSQFEYNNYGQSTNIYKFESADRDIEFSADNPYTFTYKSNVSYNSKRQVKKIEPANNVLSYYIWAYNDEFPVIKIASNNSSFPVDAIQIAVKQLTLSNVYTKDSIDSDIAKLKSCIQAFIGNTDMVTYFTYNPLIGLSSETDQAGSTNYYFYDSFGRLEKIADHDGNTIKEYLYNIQDELIKTPGNLMVSDLEYNKVEITWDAISDATGYVIYKSLDNQEYTKVSEVTNNLYSDNNVNSNTNYYYKVQTKINELRSDYSAHKLVKTKKDPPAVPTIGTLTVNSNSSITITWNNVSYEEGYTVYRSVNASSGYTAIANVGAGVTNYTNTGLSGNTSYYFKVRSYNSDYTSGYSIYKSAKTKKNPPLIPTISGGTANSNTTITLTWNDVLYEEGYKIYRATSSGGTYSYIASVGSGVTSYSNSGLPGNTTYYYKIRSYNSDYHSGYSAYKAVKTKKNPPSTPTLSSATPYSNTRIDLVWNNVSYEEGYRIYRSTNASSGYTQIATVGAGVTSYSNTGLPGNTTYYYKVRSYNSDYTSAYSGYQSAKTKLNPPGTPSISLSCSSSSAITISWNNVSGESGYKVYRGTSPGSITTLVANLSANITSYTNTGLSAGTYYYYKVIAHNADYSSTSSYKSKLTIPSQPGSISGTSSGICKNSTLSYSVAVVTGASTYNWVVPSGWTIVSGQNTSTLRVTSGTSGGTLKVRATNSSGSSSYRTTSLSMKPVPALPSSITGPTTVDAESTVTYSIPAVSNASSYNWIVPTDAVILSGDGTTSVTVRWGNTTESVSVSAVNCNGSSTYRSVFVTCKSGSLPGPL